MYEVCPVGFASESEFFAHGYGPQGWLCCVGFRSLALTIACVASVSVWFRSKERPVLAAREI